MTSEELIKIRNVLDTCQDILCVGMCDLCALSRDGETCMLEWAIDTIEEMTGDKKW